MEEVKLLKVFVGTQTYSFDGDVAIEVFQKLVTAIGSKPKYVTVTKDNLTILIIPDAITSIEKRGF